MNLIRPLLKFFQLEKHLREVSSWSYMLLLMLPVCSIAQKAEIDSTIKNDLIGISATTFAADELERFKILTSEHQSATYYYNGTAKDFGSFPVCFITDIKSLSSGSTQFSGADIEIVTIKLTTVEDIGKKVDLSRFADFPKLRYIYILSEVDVTKMAISDMLQNQSPSLIIVYTISKQT